MTLEACFARPIAHRGLHACGGNGPVENSLGAARAAIAEGYGIECDVQRSKDGEAIVFHDERLDRLTGMGGALSERSAEALAAIRLSGSNEPIPSLSDLLATVSARVPLIIEIKAGPRGDMRLADRVLALVARYAGGVVIESFDPLIVLHCLARTRYPVGLVGPTLGGADGEDIDQAAVHRALRQCHFVSWSVDALAQIASERPDLPRTTWTVRTQAQMATARQHAAQIVFEGLTPDRLF